MQNKQIKIVVIGRLREPTLRCNALFPSFLERFEFETQRKTEEAIF